MAKKKDISNQEIPLTEFSPRKADATELAAVRTYLNRKSSYLLRRPIAVGCHFSEVGVHVASAWRNGSTAEHFEPYTFLKSGDVLDLVGQCVGRIACIDDLSPIPATSTQWYSDFLEAASHAASQGSLLLFRSTRTLLPALVSECRTGSPRCNHPDQLARGAAYEALTRFYELDCQEYVAAELDGVVAPWPIVFRASHLQWVQPLWVGEAEE